MSYKVKICNTQNSILYLMDIDSDRAYEILTDAVDNAFIRYAAIIDENDEVVADTDSIISEEPDEPDYDLDMGFDPYMGCYTDDC